MASVVVERIGEAVGESRIVYGEKRMVETAAVEDHHAALDRILSLLQASGVLLSLDELDAVGHRVVHGGEKFNRPVRITREVIEVIRSLIPLAPLHNPANLEGIEAMYAKRPNLPQVAVFDTAFHQSMPEYAYTYPLPYRYKEEWGVRRYGFHGTSHAYVAKKAAAMLGKEPGEANLITLHLGNGASVTAIKAGRSIDTSMGLTPLEGLMMGTRCGDIDAAILPFISRNHGMDIDSIDKVLNKESGLKGICGTNDMREVIRLADEGDEHASLALEMYVYRIKKYIGAYSAILEEVDAIVFTGGVGEHASRVRQMVCRGLENSFGIVLDSEKNASLKEGEEAIHTKESRTAVLVVPTNEELEIVLQTEALLSDMLS
jgi:acetate kinase